MIKITIFCLAISQTYVSTRFHLFSIQNGAAAESITNILDEMAKNGDTVDGIFLPSRKGSLGSGGYGTTYRGQFIPCDNMQVAMKFSPLQFIDYSKNEYKMYKYLDAINNPSAVNDGVPTIYYYGTWTDYTIMAMTLLDSGFQKKIKDHKIEELDVYIMCREFVSQQTKAMATTALLC